MNNSTHHDNHARGPYTREALARLVLSQAAADLARGAGALVVTRNDADTGPGGRVSEARQLVEHAEELLGRAVVFERERGASWEDIAHYLDVAPQAAEERYAPELAGWSEALAEPCRFDEARRRYVRRLPTAAHAPDHTRRELDLWAHLHVTVRDLYAVGAGLRMTDPARQETYPETEPDEMTGTVWKESRLRPFLELLADYVNYPFDDTDWETIEIGLDPTDNEDPDAWYSYPLIGPAHSLEIRVARDVEEGDMVSVAVSGATAADLRLRIDTLFAAFAW
ncbi:hypothetical protein [Streptomyces shaanxiensis]|uniref:Uncharacterized protein n=1 Tax=Streptomyces shaanxiensis TaxID=653357 RepID=A0ABP7URN6_9ACTN